MKSWFTDYLTHNSVVEVPADYRPFVASVQFCKSEPFFWEDLLKWVMGFQFLGFFFYGLWFKEYPVNEVLIYHNREFWERFLGQNCKVEDPAPAHKVYRNHVVAAPNDIDIFEEVGGEQFAITTLRDMHFDMRGSVESGTITQHHRVYYIKDTHGILCGVTVNGHVEGCFSVKAYTLNLSSTNGRQLTPIWGKDWVGNNMVVTSGPVLVHARQAIAS